jgi:hypothetical protein
LILIVRFGFIIGNGIATTVTCKQISASQIAETMEPSGQRQIRRRRRIDQSLDAQI